MFFKENGSADSLASWHGTEGSLYSWAEVGIMDIYYVPDECTAFILQQVARFNLPYTSGLESLLRYGAKTALETFDVGDPYAMFWKVSDVDVTKDWSKFTYELREGRFVKELDPEFVETFVFVPGQAEAVFNKIIYHSVPSLDSLPNDIGWELKECLKEVDCWPDEAAIAVKELYPDGDIEKCALTYLELSAWAASAWFLGPLSREWRRAKHPLVDACLAHGEAILYEGNCYEPTDYRRVNRAPQSCVHCGIQSWCATEILQDNVVRLLCESCLNTGLPQFTQFSCGTKICRNTSCPHNPLHNKGDQAFYNSMRQHGQLRAGARQNASQNFTQGLLT